MRPMVVVLISLLVPAQACAGVAGLEPGRLAGAAPQFDVSRLASFDSQPPRNEDTDILLDRSARQLETVQKSLLPSLDVGPFHATVGGMDGAHAHLTTYTLDTRDFWNSSISGSVDSRGAKVTFTLPTQ
jgi:hypothetical protein